MLSTDQIIVSYPGANEDFNLAGLTLSFKAGQVTAIVGPNGSGKSTLIKSLSRVLKPTAGSISLDDRDLYEQVSSRQSAQAISVTPQDTHIAFDFTSRQIVEMGLEPYKTNWSQFSGMSQEDRVLIDNALSEAMLDQDKADRPAMTLSGGERQRTLFARALVQRSTNMLLDEPASALDVGHQVSLFRRLKNLAAQESKCIVVVLHDLNTAAAYADRVIVMSNGKVVADGTPVEVLNPDVILQVYGVRSVVAEDVITGQLRISILEPTNASKPMSGINIFCICGGGGGAQVMRCLTSMGASVTAGYINDGDTDAIVASAYGIPFIPITPFHPLPEFSYTKIQEIAASNDIVVLCPGGFGDSNQASLSSAFNIERAGLRFLVSSSLIASIKLRSPNDEIDRKLIKKRGDGNFVAFDGVSHLVELLAGGANAGTS